MSALVDGQLDEKSTERAWAHVMRCPSCRRAVEHEGWVKRRLAQMGGSLDSGDEPSSRLLGSLHDLDPVARETREAWAAVDELEQRGRGRRRAAVAAVGVGSVSAAVLGLGALGGAPLGLGQAPGGSPVTSLTRGAATTAGPLSQPGAAGGAATAVSTASSGFVPFSGWSVSAPVAARALATTSRTPR